MVDQYYSKRLNLFKIPYKVLLAYHSPIGNTIKLWTSYYMLNNILASRNDVYILNIALTIIQIKKALNTLFNRIHSRGSLLIYAQAYKALTFDHKTIFTFITSWLPGIISNYKQIASSLYYNRTNIQVLKRPQLDALSASTTRPSLSISSMVYPKRDRRIAPIPSISLSILDHDVWLNECHNLAIPSIQLCDTRSKYDQITYPIISNQRSVPFTVLLLDVFSETCHFALLYEHLHFLYYYGHFGLVLKIRKNLSKSLIKKLRKKFNKKKTQMKSNKNYYISYFNFNVDAKERMTKINQYLHYRYTKTGYHSILNKHTFILNSKLFSYKIRNFIKNNPKKSHHIIYQPLLYQYISRILVNIFNTIRTILYWFKLKKLFLKKDTVKWFKVYKKTANFYNFIFRKLFTAILTLPMRKYKRKKALYKTHINENQINSKIIFLLSQNIVSFTYAIRPWIDHVNFFPEKNKIVNPHIKSKINSLYKQKKYNIVLKNISNKNPKKHISISKKNPKKYNRTKKQKFNL